MLYTQLTHLSTDASKAAMTLDSTLYLKMASNSNQALTQEELLKGHLNRSIFVLEPNDSKNLLAKKL
jgi:hypothetical protein